MALTDIVPRLSLKRGEQQVYQGSNVEDVAQALRSTTPLLREPADVVLHPSAVEPLIVALSKGYAVAPAIEHAVEALIQDMMRKHNALYVAGVFYAVRQDETLDPLAVGLVSRY